MTTHNSSPHKRKAATEIGLKCRQGIERKKARLQPFDDDSDFALSAPASLIGSTTNATATVAESNTPFTETSSIRGGRPRPKKYACIFAGCEKAYNRPIHLQNHLNTHTGDRPHACAFEGCDKTFTKSEHLNRHVREKHAENQSKTCDYMVHDDDKGTAVPCGKTFQSAETFKRHYARHEEKEETRCTWEDCGKVFRKQETLQRHIRKDHLNELPYLCTRQTADDGTCGQAFGTPGLLKRHIERAHEAPQWFCNLCGNADAPMVETPDAPDNSLDAEFLPTAADVQVEEADATLGSDVLRALTLEETAPAGLQYPGGAVGFTSYSELQHHLKVVHPPVCTECGRKCKSRKDLAAHIDIHHSTGDNPPKFPAVDLPCPYSDCPRSEVGNGFNNKSNLNTHVKHVHQQEKKFKCGEFDLSENFQVKGWNGQGCGLALVTKAGLVSHIRTQHLNVLQPSRKKSKADKKAKDAKGEVDGSKKNASAALSMLTGYGYEERRPIACLIAPQGCQLRFLREYDLCVHMELTHGWNVDDINDAIEESKQHTNNGGDEDGWTERTGDVTMHLDPRLDDFVV